MRIAFVGKGGSGKTTLASLFARYLASQNRYVLAVDADINQHLGRALDFDELALESVPKMGLEMDKIKEYIKGDNKFIEHYSEIIKTTPPARGARFITPHTDNPIVNYFSIVKDGINLMCIGEMEEEDIGTKCYHSKTGAAELFLNHLIDKNDHYIIFDMTAGADLFASGLFTKFDLTLVVVEPTLKSINVYRQYKKYAKDYDVVIKAVANKINGDEDIKFIRDNIGDDLVAVLGLSDFVKAYERGKVLSWEELESGNLEALFRIKQELDFSNRDWEKLYRYAIDFHIKNGGSDNVFDLFYATVLLQSSL